MTPPPDSPVAGCTVQELALPGDAAVMLIVRNEELIAPRGHTALQVGDHAFVFRPADRRRRCATASGSARTVGRERGPAGGAAWPTAHAVEAAPGSASCCEAFNLGEQCSV